MARGGSISGTVRNAAAVLLRGICVRVFDSAGAPAVSAVTGPDGRFSVGGLVSGNYRLRFSDCGAGTYSDEFYNNQPDLASATQIVVVQGSETTGIDATLSSPDSNPPDTIITAGPTGTITVNQATFSFVGNPAGDTAKVQCRIDSQPFADCASPKTFTGLSEGAHTVVFRAEDAAGNQDPTPATRTFTVATTTQSTATLTAAKAGGGSGLVTSLPSGIDCGEDCSQTYTVGSVVTLTASPGPGSYFAGWSRAGCSRATTCQVVVTSDLTATATFSKVAVASPSIRRVTVSGPVKVKAGKRAAYRVRISNSGKLAAVGVRLTVSGRGIRFSGRVGKISAGSSRTLKVRLRPRKPGKLRVTFRVTSGNAGSKAVVRRITVRR
jgi:hypothetical protein